LERHSELQGSKYLVVNSDAPRIPKNEGKGIASLRGVHTPRATLSNCGETLKLTLPTTRLKAEKLGALIRETGESLTWGRGKDLGYGKNVLDEDGNPGFPG